jgi:hypothetical protein
LAGVEYCKGYVALGYAAMSLNDFEDDRKLLQNVGNILLYSQDAGGFAFENFQDLLLRIDSLERAVDRMLRRDVLSASDQDQIRSVIKTTLEPLCESPESFRRHLWNAYPGSKPYDHSLLGYLSREEYDSGFSDADFKVFQERVKRIISFFNRTLPYSMNEQEKDLIKNPCPVIFASRTIHGVPLGGGGTPGELAVLSPLFLGRDIQMIYTSAEKVRQIDAFTRQFGVQVRSFEEISS